MEAVIARSNIDALLQRYQDLIAYVPLRPVSTELEYKEAIAAINGLLDAGGADQNSPLADLVNTLGTLISEYESRVHIFPTMKPADILRFLMKQHQLTQADLPEVGSQGVISEILRGKRSLNVRQIKVLAARFHLPVTTFL
ncbi:transcriptional regulator [Duganella fentianensis]|uniref:helix-turn-helix domain-containing protein n=1 Tax=Duganella fentianensis TaxID=2692177 RepID=UPI0032B1CD96